MRHARRQTIGRVPEQPAAQILLVVALLAPGVLVGRPAQAQTGKVRGAATEWSSYGGDKASSKYSPLDQIGAGNFNRLKVAWTWRSPDEAITKANPKLKTWVWESTPLVVGGVMYVSTSMSQVAALDAATGKTRWVYDPGDVEERNAVQQWLRASRRRLLGGRGRSTHPVRHRRRLPDLR